MPPPRVLSYVCAFACLVLLGTQTGRFFSHPADDGTPPPLPLRSYTFVPKPPPPSSVGLIIPDKQLDFGEVWEDARFQWTLVIENRSSKEIRIEKWGAGCDCLAPKPASLTIAGGANVAVVLTIDLTASPGKHSVAAARPFRTWLQPTIQSDAGKEVMLGQWELSGTVRKVFDFRRLEIALGKHSERSQPIPSQLVRIKTAVPTRTVTATCSSAHFGVEVKQCEDTPLEHELAIAPKGVVPIGRYRFDIHLHAELRSGQRVQSSDISAYGEIGADIQASPPQVCLGAVKRGKVATEFVTLSSMTGSAFKVVGYRVEATGLAIDQHSNATPAEQPTFRLCQRIEHIGPRSGSAVFVIRRDDGSKAEVRVPVDYHGID